MAKVKMSKGKFDGINAVADKNGVIAALAIDQRGSLKKAIAKAKGGDASDAELSEFKVLVSEHLTPYASAILLDPEWGLPASKRRAKGSATQASMNRPPDERSRSRQASFTERIRAAMPTAASRSRGSRRDSSNLRRRIR